MEGVNHLLSIKHHAVSVWHPCGNCMIERFNIFAYSNIVNGRRLREPMAILRQLWTDKKVEGEIRMAYRYVTELKHQTETVCQLAQENIAAAQGKQERLYNKKVAARSYQPGDWVL